MVNLMMNLSIVIPEGFGEIVMRFALNLVIITVLVRYIYYAYKKDHEFVFTFFLFNVIIFFVCHLMLKSDISLGMAFGLFAIFGILRYRTSTIPIKEMTYLFLAIAIALINAMGAFDLILAFMNIVIVAFTYIMEKIWFTDKQQSKNVIYEKIELIQANKKEEIIEDLKMRTGLNIQNYEIKSINFINDSASLRIYYTPE